MTPITTIHTDYPEVEPPICNPEPPKKVEAVVEKALPNVPPVVVHVAPKKEEKTAATYTEDIKRVLGWLTVQTDKGQFYDPREIESRYESVVKLLKELQGKNFVDERYTRYRNQLEVLVNDYVGQKFTNYSDKNLVRLATEYLSFSRKQNELPPMPFEETLATFINTYANRQFMRFDNPQELSDVPVGIKNTDKASCFACAWMQLVANNRLLSGAYSAVRGSENFRCAQQVLSAYGEVQTNYQVNQKLLGEVDPKEREAVEQLLTLQPENIGSMRRIIGAPGQQDASELISNLNNEIVIDANGKVGDIKLGAKIVKKVKNFQKGTEGVSPLDRIYTFPSRQFILVPTDRFPSLYTLENTPDISVDDHEAPVAETTVYFAEVPNIVVYQLGRLVEERDPKTYAVTKRYVNRTEVDMPLYHTLATLEATLKLQGFIRHTGNAKGGHYISYMTQDNKYWLANDARVTEITAADFLIAARDATTAVYSTVRKSTVEGKE